MSPELAATRPLRQLFTLTNALALLSLVATLAMTFARLG